MSRYDRSYDYGLRGSPNPHYGRHERIYAADYERRADPEGRRANRVTAPYNYDYVFGGRGGGYPRNYNAYTGDHPGRIGDRDSYHRPYLSRGGTRTWRGTTPPQRYDVPSRGPDYGGRYDDELR